ncbi:hypothetical protein L484_023502 [Morus notabilis]|uniref:Uncharacterized protein n=1 Tax=Morus notabilis TaxID=981085 RepID=W9RDQ7_9ROSA|nr:hypothetical protein L484_023502 [Morus notabilis]
MTKTNPNDPQNEKKNSQNITEILHSSNKTLCEFGHSATGQQVVLLNRGTSGDAGVDLCLEIDEGWSEKIDLCSLLEVKGSHRDLRLLRS